MEFLAPYAFLALLAIPFLFFLKNSKLPFKKEILNKIIIKYGFDKKKRFYVFIISYFFLVIALARPVSGIEKTKLRISSSDIIILLSAGSEMKCQDIYPNRFEAAVEKLKSLFKKLNYQNIALLLVKEKPYLISPPSTDYNSIIYLLKHVNKQNLFKERANFQKAFKAAQKLAKHPIIVTISDRGFENADISYITALKPCKTVNGISIPQKNGIVFTYSSKDIDQISKKIQKISKSKEITITNQKELFYYPLAFGILLFFIGSFSLRRKN